MIELFISILTPFITIAPMTNDNGTCVVNAYMHCELYYANIPQKYHKKITPYATIVRDKIRDKYMSQNTWNPNYKTFFPRLIEKWVITTRKETPEYSTWVAIVREYKFNWYIMSPWEKAETWHAVCIIGQTKDYYIAINDQWTKGIWWYVLIDKKTNILFYEYK